MPESRHVCGFTSIDFQRLISKLDIHSSRKTTNNAVALLYMKFGG
jgi:hypothetical protein